MAAAKSNRKRHVQQELFRHGGKRRGAGRKPRGSRAGECHDARPEFKSYHPLHVAIRVVPAVGSLRRRTMYKALREASITAARREWFRIVHISLQRNHVHMLVEAEDKAALARGMQGFQISAAKHVNELARDRRRLVAFGCYGFALTRSMPSGSCGSSLVQSTGRVLGGLADLHAASTASQILGNVLAPGDDVGNSMRGA